jgi:hypothetical protein
VHRHCRVEGPTGAITGGQAPATDLHPPNFKTGRGGCPKRPAPRCHPRSLRSRNQPLGPNSPNSHAGTMCGLGLLNGSTRPGNGGIESGRPPSEGAFPFDYLYPCSRPRRGRQRVPAVGADRPLETGNLTCGPRAFVSRTDPKHWHATWVSAVPLIPRRTAGPDGRHPTARLNITVPVPVATADDEPVQSRRSELRPQPQSTRRLGKDTDRASA